MENFFYDDRFCSDISDIFEIFDIEEEKLNELSETWNCKVELTTLEPVFKVDAEELSELLLDCNEERLSENFDDSDEKKIKKAITESCDFEKLKDLLPKYYYPNGKFVTITKKDLIEWCA